MLSAQRICVRDVENNIKFIIHMFAALTYVYSTYVYIHMFTVHMLKTLQLFT